MPIVLRANSVGAPSGEQARRVNGQRHKQSCDMIWIWTGFNLSKLLRYQLQEQVQQDYPNSMRLCCECGTKAQNEIIFSHIKLAYLRLDYCHQTSKNLHSLNVMYHRFSLLTRDLVKSRRSPCSAAAVRSIVSLSEESKFFLPVHLYIRNMRL